MSLSTTQYGYIIDPLVPLTDDTGRTISNGYVRVFVAGTSTPVITYANFEGTANQERIELDNSGRTATKVIGSKGSAYKVCVYDAEHSQETPILTVDKVVPAGANVEATNVITGLDTVEAAGQATATVDGTSVTIDVPRIKDLTNTATEADLVAGNYFDIDGSEGMKKLPADNIVQRNVMTCNSFFGKGSTYSEVKVENVVPGENYILTFPVTAWPRDNTGIGANWIFGVKYIDTSNVSHDITQVYRGGTIPKFFSFAVPSDAAYLLVGGRANDGEQVLFNIERKEYPIFCGLANINDSHSYAINFPSGQIAITLATKTGTVVYVNKQGTLYNFNVQYFIDNFSATLTDYTLTFTFNNNRFIVFDTTDNSLKIVANTALKPTDYILLGKASGTVCGPIIDFAMAAFGQNDLWKKGFQFYPYAGAFPKSIYIEENANGSLFVKLETTFYLRVMVSKTYTQASLLTELSATSVTSTQGVADCLEIASTYNLVFDPFEKVFKVVSRDDADKYINLIGCVSGTLAYADDIILTLLRNKYAVGNDGVAKSSAFASALSDIANNYSGSEKEDLFLFFTDPHSFKATTFDRTTYLDSFNAQIGTIAKWVSELPLDFVLSGGDWVQSSQLKADVIKYLSVANGKMRSMFSKELVSLVGNHEYNTYGTGSISGDEIAQFLLAGISSKAYYTKKTKNAILFCLDSGDDAWDYTNVLQTYQIEELEWFIAALIDSTDEKKAVLTHKLCTTTPQSVTDEGVIYYADMNLFSKTMLDIIGAFNTRTSYTFNGTSYDFSSGVGYVEYVVAGHVHKDAVGDYNGLPLLLTKNLAADGSDFDIVSADYDNSVLKTTRVGTGSNRQFTMYSGTL